jgi:hypothetical protein
MKLHHDQGRVHFPLYTHSIADPEPLDHILDVSLGRGYITPRGRTSEPYNGLQLIQVFNMTAQSRKELLCAPCFDEKLKAGYPHCSCTFRKRLLDRWVCMPCHMKQVASDKELEKRLLVDPHTGTILSRRCRCKTAFTIFSGDYRTIWNRCRGAIHDEEVKKEEEDEDEDAKSWKDREDDDKIAAATPSDLVPNEMRTVEEKDGTLFVFCDGARISGERLSRALISAWIAKNGRKLPCTCCGCPIGGCRHSQDNSHGRDGDEDAEEAEDDDERMDEDEIRFMEGVMDFDEEQIDSDVVLDEELD